MYHAVKLAEEM